MGLFAEVKANWLVGRQKVVEESPFSCLTSLGPQKDTQRISAWLNELHHVAPAQAAAACTPLDVAADISRGPPATTGGVSLETKSVLEIPGTASPSSAASTSSPSSEEYSSASGPVTFSSFKSFQGGERRPWNGTKCSQEKECELLAPPHRRSASTGIPPVRWKDRHRSKLVIEGPRPLDQQWLCGLAASEVVINSLLGSGPYGRKYHGTHKGEDVVMKLLTLPKYVPADQMAILQRQFRYLAEGLYACSHRNIIHFHGLASGPGRPQVQSGCGSKFRQMVEAAVRIAQWGVVVEYLPGGDLATYCRKHGKPSPERAVDVALDVARGLQYLHGRGLIHNDVRPENLYLDATGLVKLGNFEDALLRALNPLDIAVQRDAPLNWMAPEVIEKKEFSNKCNVWSFGMLFWFLLTGEEPFAKVHFVQLAFGIVEECWRPAIPASCPAKLARLLEACWEQDPAKRPTMDDVVTILDRYVTPLSPFKKVLQKFRGHPS